MTEQTKKNEVKGINLSWIVVRDLDAAVKYFTEIVGLELREKHEQFGWAELSGKDGSGLMGIAQSPNVEAMPPGTNAIMTFTVENLEAKINEFTSKGGKIHGEVVEVPGHVKMQDIEDADGNRFQFVELLNQK